MKQVNDRIVFLADSESVDSEDYSYPGQIFYEASPIDYEPYINKQTVVTPETQDRWGLWISVLVPIIDDNEVIAVLGLDFDANHFKKVHGVEVEDYKILSQSKYLTFEFHGKYFSYFEIQKLQ